MTDKLKPCPFCGGEARIRDLNIKIPYEGIAHFVGCCQCDVRSGISFDGEQAAIEAWNTRKPMDRIVERLEYALNNCIPRINCKECNKREKTVYEMALEYAIEIVKTGGKGE